MMMKQSTNQHVVVKDDVENNAIPRIEQQRSIKKDNEDDEDWSICSSSSSSSYFFISDDNDGDDQYSSITTKKKKKQQRRRNNNNNNNNNKKKKKKIKLAQLETRKVSVLRITVLLLNVIIAIVMAISVYKYMHHIEHTKFITQYEDSAYDIIEQFHHTVEQSLNAIGTLSTTITSYSMDDNTNNNTSKLPFITIPNFELHGSNLRLLSSMHSVHWLPLIHEEQRIQWEEYAIQHRSHIDNAYEMDTYYRNKQDNEYYTTTNTNHHHERILNNDDNAVVVEETIFDDGTGYHSKIWSNGSIKPRGDEPIGSGPYLPWWQRSPIDASKQRSLNMNFANTGAFYGALPVMERNHKAVMMQATIPIPAMEERLKAILELSQYRHEQDMNNLAKGPNTFLAYPVFDSFDDDNKSLAGVLLSNIYWKNLFSNLLSNKVSGIICVINNSFNQTFAFQIDLKHAATYLGMDDPHDSKYNSYEISQDVNTYLENRVPGQKLEHITYKNCLCIY